MGNRTDTASVIAGNRYSSFHGTSVGYDADGNVILKSKAGGHRREYAWTADNLLLTALLDSTAWVRYDYNAYGEPVRKLRSTATSAWWVDSYFLWDRGQLLAEFDSAGKRRADYIYSPGVDEPFAETLGDSTPVATRYHQQDALGNVIGTIAGGDSSQTASYDSWGVPSLSGNADNRLLWKGLMWEGDVVSLYYARNRWYDPEMGRFVSEDPIGHDGGDNLYAFSGDDPVDGSDPSGTCPKGTNPGTYNGLPVCIPVLTPSITRGTPDGVNPRGASCDPGYESDITTCAWENAFRGGRWVGAERTGIPEAQGQPPYSVKTWRSGRAAKWRSFGGDGRGDKDVDWGHNHGAGDPHTHDWDWSKPNPRGPGRPVSMFESPFLDYLVAHLRVPFFIVPIPVLQHNFMPRCPNCGA